MLTARIQEAFEYAAICHAGHVRKDTRIPYLSHLMAVASLVMEAAADGKGDVPQDYEDLVIAALLHDVVEDCGGASRLEDVRRRFGARVAAVVAHCTDYQPAQGESRPPWAERKSRYIDHLRTSPDIWAVLVSAADKLHNARAIVSDLRTVTQGGGNQQTFWLRFSKNKSEAELARRVPEILWYYDRLAKAIENRTAAPPASDATRRLGRLARELHAVVNEMLELARDAGYAPQEP